MSEDAERDAGQESEAAPEEFSALRRSVAEVSGSEARFRALVMATTDILWAATPAWELTADLPLWRALTGQSEAEILGRGWLRAVHPEDEARLADVWQEAARAARSFHAECRLRRSDGSYDDFAVSGAPLLDEGGQIKEWFGSYTQITERKRAERALAVSEARFRALATNAPVGIFQTDASGNCVFVNQRWCAIAGLTPEEASGSGWSQTLARAASAVRLLGAQIVLSGIRPEVAVALVTLGASLEGVVTCGTLEAGIAYAMGSAGGRQRDARGR
jgi:PAS domain S-box-containing protein